jgi:quinol monooxygenase YgiN
MTDDTKELVVEVWSDRREALETVREKLRSMQYTFQYEVIGPRNINDSIIIFEIWTGKRVVILQRWEGKQLMIPPPKLKRDQKWVVTSFDVFVGMERM